LACAGEILILIVSTENSIRFSRNLSFAIFSANAGPLFGVNQQTKLERFGDGLLSAL